MMKKLMLLLLGFIVSGVIFAQSGYQIGDKATDFKLKNIDGKMVSMADYEDAKGFIVIFTCNHCPYSVAYEDRIIELDKKYKSKGYPVIAINPNDPAVQPQDSFEKMIERAKSKDFTFPYLFDDGDTLDKIHQESYDSITRAVIRIINSLKGYTAKDLRHQILTKKERRKIRKDQLQ